jgi:hypothetical protein
MSQITFQVIITKHYFKHDVNLVIIIDFLKLKIILHLPKKNLKKRKEEILKRKKKDAC